MRNPRCVALYGKGGIGRLPVVRGEVARPGRLRALLLLAVGLGASLVSPLGVADCVSLSGKLTQGGLAWGALPAGSSATLDGKPLDVLPDGTTLLGFGRDAPASAELVVQGAAPCRQSLAIAAREYRIQRVEGVPQQTVTPSPEHQARIARERKLVADAKAQRFKRPDLLQDALSGFSWPTQGPISGVYGSQRYYNGNPGSPHYGVDVAVPTGTPVRAPAAGIVTLAETDLFYSGGTIILDHGYGLSSSFLHLSAVEVAPGDEVARGALLGAVGASGRATGPHLDWRMSWRNERIDPQLLVPPMPAQ
ncbi:MAG: M23 family metallopeptidase [Halioglobus sp.]